MHLHYLSVPFPFSLLCIFQPAGQQKQGETSHGILPFKHSQNAMPGWKALLLVPFLGNTCDAHVLFCCLRPPGPRTCISTWCPLHTPQRKTDGNCGIEMVWKPVVLPMEEHHSRRWESGSGGAGWG